MGLDIYISKKTFIGAMFHASGVNGIISLTKRGKQIPIKLRRVAYVIEDIYHGSKTYWLLDWLNRELPEELMNAKECEISEDVIKADDIVTIDTCIQEIPHHRRLTKCCGMRLSITSSIICIRNRYHIVIGVLLILQKIRMVVSRANNNIECHHL